MRQSSGETVISLVLLVEDHDDTRSAWREFFEEAGYHVTEASNGNEALAAALADPPDVVVLDLTMPELDGWETARLFRSYPTTRAIPIVACSALSDAVSRERALAAGCDYFVAKPCFPEVLVAAVRVAMAQGPKTGGHTAS
jgi:two-component system cell cycle response regulator DivK